MSGTAEEQKKEKKYIPHFPVFQYDVNVIRKVVDELLTIDKVH